MSMSKLTTVVKKILILNLALGSAGLTLGCAKSKNNLYFCFYDGRLWNTHR